MKNHELIEKLSKGDPEGEVWVLSVFNEKEETEYDGTYDPPSSATYIVALDDGFVVRVERNVATEEPGRSRVEQL